LRRSPFRGYFAVARIRSGILCAALVPAREAPFVSGTTQEATTQTLVGSPAQPPDPQADTSTQTPGTPNVVAQSASVAHAVQFVAALVHTF
jgi:hypothetical protein